MKRAWAIGGAALLAGVLAATSRAQPVLDEVERSVRRQVGAPTLPAAGGPAAPATQPGYLGVVADDRGENGRGIRIREVLPGGPAAQGGLQGADLVTAVNNRPVRTLDDMAQILGPLPAGQQVEFQVERAGKTHKAAVILGTRPVRAERRFPEFGKQPETPPPSSDPQTPAKPVAGAPGGPLLGVRTVPLTADLRQRFGVPAETGGALISAVTVHSPADKIGLAPGMVITTCNGQPVSGPEVLSALVRQAGPGREVDLMCWDQNGPTRYRVTLAGGTPVADVPGPLGAGGEQPPAQPPAPPAFTPSPAPTESPTEQLERRVQMLEARLDRLEAALREKQGGQ